MINDLRNWTEGYIDWNLFLDETGGPNHVNNLCSAPVMVKIWQEELVLMPSYYYIGQISKFVKPKAVQMASTGTKDVIYVAFKNQDLSEVIIIQNESDQDRNIEITGLKENIKLTIEAHSISSIVL